MAYPTKTDPATILATALQQVEDAGVEGLAMRCVAAKLGLAPNALYRYFDGLTNLESAVAEEVRRQMREAMQQAAADQEPLAAIRAISWAYLRFAHDRPKAFALFLKASETGCATPQCTQNTQFLLEQVARVYGDEHSKEAAHALWAFLQGLAVLCEANVLSEAELSASYEFGMKMWSEGASRPPCGE